MQASLSFLAGHKAYAYIRERGLAADAVKVVAGAAGGPKWLALSQIDRVLFGGLLAGRSEPLFMLGSSIGSWRMAAVSQRDPIAALDRFEQAYIAQRYRRKPSARKVSDTSMEILRAVIPESGAAEILAHPSHRLNVITARSRGAVANCFPPALALGVAGAAVCNVVTAASPGVFFRRTVFHDPRESAPFLQAAGFGADLVPLANANLHAALLASGSIPFVMSGMENIAGAPPGVYHDGGLIDYHLNVPFLEHDDDGIVLFPHFGERIVPGWFDKTLPWRRAARERMAHVLLVAPSPVFVATLPFGKIPDRRDFYRFEGRDDERIAYWRAVVDACRRLGDELADVLATNRLPALVRPFP